MTTSMTPMEDAIKQKACISHQWMLHKCADNNQITQELKPTSLEIFNDSHKHAHHKAMAGVTSRETHFRQVDYIVDLRIFAQTVNIVSDAFKSKMQPARHRMVYTLLKDEMAVEGGIHALQLKTRTPEEEEKAQAREA
ncbi:hypothetical protein E4T39_03521 [Aureobasidium subglaciale]|nr:hypothetical protein E4T39_03521 [Aureobasidium subglaciale]